MTPKELIARLEIAAEAVTNAIDKAISQTERDVLDMQKALYSILRDELLPRLETRGGVILNTKGNLALVSFLDSIFDAWRRDHATEIVSDYVVRLLATASMVGAYYREEADKDTVERIASDTSILAAALGVTTTGDVLRGSVVWEILQADEVRKNIKNNVVRSILASQGTREFLGMMRDYITGTKESEGVLTRFWQANALDNFNRAAEVQNEQFREALDLRWFIYVGDIIKDSRDFCIKKAGKIFATIEADQDWPKDPDLIGKTSGVPYTPRIDRGRWNCRHRIRYISEELAVQIDPKKVSLVKKKYGKQWA